MTNTDETYHCGTLLDASGDATLISGTWPAAVESADILSCEVAPKSVRARNLHDAQGHTEFVDAFYRIGRERANKIVVLTGARGGFIIDVDRLSVGNVSDPEVWSQAHDEGVQALENIANILVPVIAAIEGRAHVHSDYVLLANIIVAGEGATFQDVAHYAVGVAPGDGIFITWSYRGGAGPAETFLLYSKPLPARTAQQWGVVAEVGPNGQALEPFR